LFLIEDCDVMRSKNHCCAGRESGKIQRVKYWEIISDNLSKAGWSYPTSQRWIAKGEQYGLLTLYVPYVFAAESM
jgi:hypothetical protein